MRATGLFCLFFVLLVSPVTGILAAEGDDIFSRLDANDDGVVTRDEIPEGKQTLFSRLLRTSDKNQDGKISQSEFADGTTSKPPVREVESAPINVNADQFFKRLDRNGDGKLQKGELPERVAAALGRIDGDGDGTLNQEEFARIASRLAEMQSPDAKQVFQRLDKNRDGKLTRDEIPAERREFFDRVLQRLDTDGDKALNLPQFGQALALGRAMEPNAQPNNRNTNRNSNRNMTQGPGALMRILDTNRDGKLSAAEIAAATGSLKQLDRNGDGQLTANELSNISANAQPAKNTTPAANAGNRVKQFLQRLRQVDANGDKKISKQEAPERLKPLFDRIDSNKDGQLDETELRRIASIYGGRQQQNRQQPNRQRPEQE